MFGRLHLWVNPSLEERKFPCFPNISTRRLVLERLIKRCFKPPLLDGDANWSNFAIAVQKSGRSTKEKYSRLPTNLRWSIWIIGISEASLLALSGLSVFDYFSCSTPSVLAGPHSYIMLWFWMFFKRLLTWTFPNSRSYNLKTFQSPLIIQFKSIASVSPWILKKF